MAGSGCNAYQIRKIYAIGGALGMVNKLVEVLKGYVKTVQKSRGDADG